ncbi:MAG: hypothetical protein GY807_03615 [Gammaproteobacteria bacterium]|nr:hypothetical protein [Gammaproteobacteria bacterium]
MLRIVRHDQALPLYNGAHQARFLPIKQCLLQLLGLHVEGDFAGGVSVHDRITRAC